LDVLVPLPNSEDGVDQIELVSLKMELLLHARDICIVEITAVQIIGEIAETTKRQDECINFSEKLGFARHSLLAPDIGLESSEDGHAGQSPCLSVTGGTRLGWAKEEESRVFIYIPWRCYRSEKGLSLTQKLTLPLGGYLINISP
jgi:hypothetical protein